MECSAMNLTSGEYDSSVNEFDVAKLTPQASMIVRPPRVVESPVSFGCKLHQILDFSTAPTSGSLVIGQIVSIHMNDAHLKDGKLDRNSLEPDRTHGWDSVHEDYAAIRDGETEGGVTAARSRAVPAERC